MEASDIATDLVEEPEFEESETAGPVPGRLDSTEPEIEAVDDAAAGDAALKRRFFNVQTLISFAIAFGILYFVVKRMDVDFGQIFARMRMADPLTYVIALIVYYSSFLVRAWRWQLLLKNVGFRKRHGFRLPSLSGLTEIVLLSWFTNCIMPARLGDAYRSYLLKKACGVSFSKTLGTILAERIIDVLVLFTLLALAGLNVFRGTMPEAFESMLIGGGVLVAVVIVSLVAMLKFSSAMKRLLPSRLEQIYERFQEGTLLSFQNLPLVVFATLLVWAAEIGRLWFIMASLSVGNVALSVVIFVALAASLLTTIPMTPAGLGVVESALMGLLLLLNSMGAVQGVDKNLATVITVLDRTVSYWSLIVVGLLVYLFAKRSIIAQGCRRVYCASASIIPRR